MGSMKSVKFSLDDETYRRLHSRFGGDEKAMQDFVARVLAEQLKENPGEQNAPGSEKNRGNLDDYLKSGKPGSRSYGIKGQGW